MKEGDLVQFKFFKGSSTNLDNLGIVLELQTAILLTILTFVNLEEEGWQFLN